MVMMALTVLVVSDAAVPQELPADAVELTGDLATHFALAPSFLDPTRSSPLWRASGAAWGRTARTLQSERLHS